jgi:hypothetical protein
MKKSFMPTKKENIVDPWLLLSANEVLHAPPKKKKKEKECESMATSFHNEVLLTHKTRNMNSCTSL